MGTSFDTKSNCCVPVLKQHLEYVVLLLTRRQCYACIRLFAALHPLKLSLHAAMQMKNVGEFLGF